MINVNDIKNGMTIEHENNIYVILEFLHVKPGKGPAFVRTKLRNLRTGSIIEKTFNTNIKFKQAMVSKKDMQFLYNSSNTYTFMDTETYEQIEIDGSKIKEEIKYLKENLTVVIVFYENELLGLEVPDKIEMKVVEAEPSVKGNTVTNATKRAVLETGMEIQVPLFINEGETIIVSSKDGKYDSRK